MTLSVREIQKEDIDLLANHWLIQPNNKNS